ncbi:MAG: hypothetical protein JWO53_573 [Chlamydiia bacterium]|nr:hypothetical protein [Chlamydiia bacterium]
MTKFLWLADLHLDAIDPDIRDNFFEKIALEKEASAILVGGDTADGAASLGYLQKLQKISQKPLYFILGNHDFYGESMAIQKKRASDLAHKEKDFYYLTQRDPIELSPTTALIGHDGWADGQDGALSLSTVCLRDHFEIEELKARSPDELAIVLQELGEEAALEVERKLRKAFQKYQKVIFLTHAPPFREACLYENKVASDLWAPHFVAKAVGDTLKRLLQEFPGKECVVLAGHTHHEANVQILKNLEIKVTHTSLTVGDTLERLLFEFPSKECLV